MEKNLNNLTENEKWLIDENLIIKKCEKYCIEHNVPFNYIKNNNDLFFVFGLNKDKVDNPDIKQEYIRNIKNKDLFFTDLLYIKLNNQSPYCIAKKIVYSLQGLSFIKTNFSERNKEIPESVPLIHLVNWYGAADYNNKFIKKFLSFATMRDVDDLSFGLDILKEEEEKTGELSLQELRKSENSLTSIYIKHKYIKRVIEKLTLASINFSVIKNKTQKNPLIIFDTDFKENVLNICNNLNCISSENINYKALSGKQSLEDLVLNSKTLNSIRIKPMYINNIGGIEFFEKELEKANVPFNISEINNIKLDYNLFPKDIPNGDLTHYLLTYDAKFNNIVSFIYLKTIYPDIFKRYLIDDSLNNFANESTHSFGIDEDSLCDFVNNCERLKIKIGISKDNFLYNDIPNNINIVCFKKDAERVEEVLFSLLDLYNDKNNELIEKLRKDIKENKEQDNDLCL